MNPGCFTALLVGLAEVGSCTMCFFCIPYVLSEFNWWTAEHQHNLMFTETASGLFQEFSFSIHRVVLCWERLWCWVRMVFLRLSSVSYLPGLAVLFNSPGAVLIWKGCNGAPSLQGVVYPCAYSTLSAWNFWLAEKSMSRQTLHNVFPGRFLGLLTCVHCSQCNWKC